MSNLIVSKDRPKRHAGCYGFNFGARSRRGPQSERLTQFEYWDARSGPNGSPVQGVRFRETTKTVHPAGLVNRRSAGSAPSSARDPKSKP
jgi:hypothetical protein